MSLDAHWACLVDNRLRRSTEPGATTSEVIGLRSHRLTTTFADGLVMELRHSPGRLSGSKVLVLAVLSLPGSSAVQALYPLVCDQAWIPDQLQVALVDGFQSWDWAGPVQGRADLVPTPFSLAEELGPARGRSWWSGGFDFVRGALCLQALSARRTATAVLWNAGGGMWVESAGSPLSLGEQRTGDAQALAEGRALPIRSDPLEVAWAPDLDSGRAALAGAAASVAGAPVPVSTRAPMGWMSWYHHGVAVTPEIVLEQARRTRELDPGGDDLVHVQLDDGWQRHFGDWRVSPRFGTDQDMQRLTAALRGMGFSAGIWWAPFLVSPHSELALDPARAEWLLRDSQGLPFIDPRNPDQGHLVLDSTHPEVEQHLRRTVAKFREWGFNYIKSDFLYAGGYELPRARPMSGMAALRGALETIAQAAREPGPASLMACGGPWLSALGLMDLWRAGGDNGAPLYDPQGVPAEPANGVPAMLMELRNWLGRIPLHRAGMILDPDALMVSGGPLGPQFTTDSARTAITAWAMSGGSYFLSDDLAGLPQSKLDLLANPEVRALAGRSGSDAMDGRRLLPARAIDHYLAVPEDLPRLWVRRGEGRVVLAGLALPGIPTGPISITAPDLGVGPGWTCRDLWARRDLGPVGASLELAGLEVTLLYEFRAPA